LLSRYLTAWKNEIMANPVLDAIKKRRTVARFDGTQVDDKKVQDILEAGRWAPSWINRQPWSFIVIKDQGIKERLSEVVPTVFVQGLKEAPICIAVTVDPAQDSYHYVEAAAAASQNMALAAHSLGLGSSWIGVYDAKSQKSSAETKIKEILGVPRNQRVIALLPIGQVRYDVPKKERKELKQIVFHEKFGQR
jgi:nitroreductase